MDKIQREMEQVSNLRHKGYSRKQIAEELNLTERQVKRRIYNYNKNERASIGDGILSSSIGVSLDKEREYIDKLVEEKYPNGNFNLLGISDLHIPFHKEDIILEIAEENSSDILVICGDMLDCYSLSAFSQDKFIPIQEEISIARKLLENLDDFFNIIIILRGNHEKRLNNYIENKVDPQFQMFVNKSVLSTVTEGFNNIYSTDSFWTIIGDTVFAHPSSYSQIPMRTSNNTSTFLKNRNISHNNCIIGHTHKCGDIITQEVRCMEIGCLCRDMDYQLNSGRLTLETWQRAYLRANFYNFNMNYNSSRIFNIQR